MSCTTTTHNHTEQQHALLFHQVNVGKGGENMDIALPQAISFACKGLSATQIFPSSQDQTGNYCFVKACRVTFVNLYCAPGLNDTLDSLLRWRPSGPAVVGGASTPSQGTGNHRLLVSTVMVTK